MARAGPPQRSGSSRATGAFMVFAVLSFPVALPVETVAAQSRAGSAGESTIPDSIHRDLADGRYWKAGRALRAHLAPVGSATVEDRMLLAEAEAGWRNWEGAVAALTADGGDAVGAPPRFWYLLGTFREETADHPGAVEALTRFVEAVPAGAPDGLVARSRLARALAETGAATESLAAVAALGEMSRQLGDWTALSVARTLGRGGEGAAVREVLALVVEPAIMERGWHLETDAWAQAGDTARALDALMEVLARGRESGASRAEILALEWRYRLAEGDSAGSVVAMEELLRRTTRGAEALAAALAHWRVATNSGPEVLRTVAGALGSGNEFGTAVRAWRLAERRGAVLTERELAALARAYNGSGDRDGAVRVYRELAASGDPAVAAPALRAWAAIRTRQGRHGDARTLQDRIVERFPSRTEALDVIFFRGDDHHDAGRTDEAIDHYRQVISMSASANRAGLARMRWGQLHLGRGHWGAALGVFEGYLEEFPDGRRWEEASYWAAHAATALGDTAEASRQRARIREVSPLSYYAYLSARADGETFAPDLREGPPLPDPEWLSRDLEVLALLEAAGLAEALDAHVASMKTTATGSEELQLRLAIALHEAGRTLDGIRLGLELRSNGRAWDLALARVVYPFPYRQLVTSRARELGLDPYLLAGLIRQESAFVPDIVSPAGAIGLTQVMPATGREVARAVGPRGFRIEMLETPELNVHLGTHFLSELFKRYDGDIPLVLSAYNAGPTRANRWRRLPEAEDPHRFTERIPFVETRGYVKNVTRNRALYRWLYGGAQDGE
ncbi:MAG: transglycosylase SLT domain-containing protein [Gemmatimonadota bacterium]|nr:transglycosylase SLT domain-containing protein [Gemmatimonadota bacterium]